MDNGAIITGAAGIAAFRLLQLRGAVRLEAKGMKHSSGRSARKMAALELGLKASAKPEAVIAAIEAKLAELRGEVAP